MLSDNRSKTLDRYILAFAICTFAVTSALLLDDNLFFRLHKNRSMPGAPIARITSSEKDVRRRLDGDIIWFPVRLKDAVFQDDNIFTGDASKTEVMFEDQTSIAVSAQSLVRISVQKGQTTLSLVSGSLRVKVGPKSKVVLISNGKTKTISGNRGIAEVTAIPKEAPSVVAVSGTIDMQEGKDTPIQQLVAQEEVPEKKEEPLVAENPPEPQPEPAPAPAPTPPREALFAEEDKKLIKKIENDKTKDIAEELPEPTQAPIVSEEKLKTKLIEYSDLSIQSSFGFYSYTGQSGTSGLNTESSGFTAKIGVEYKAWFNEKWGAAASGSIMNLRNLSDSSTLLKTASIDANYQWLNPQLKPSSFLPSQWHSFVGLGLGMREDLQVNTPTTRTYPLNLGIRWRAEANKQISSSWRFDSSIIGFIPMLTTQSGTNSDSIGSAQLQFLNFDLQANMTHTINEKMFLSFGLMTQRQNTKYTQALGTTINSFSSYQFTASLTFY